MHWTPEHEGAFVKEMLLFEPWQYKKSSPERGNVWKLIAESLSQLEELYFRVNDRSLRDKYKLLEKNYNSKKSRLEKASGVDVPEETEMEMGLADIIQQFKDCEARATEEKDQKKDEADKEVAQAEEFRRQSLETIGKTKKRTNEDECNKVGKRRKSDGTIEYLREKNVHEQELRKQEMELKKAELTDRREEIKTFRDMLLQQQQQNAALMQQQLNMALLQFIAQQKKNNEKHIYSYIFSFGFIIDICTFF